MSRCKGYRFPGGFCYQWVGFVVRLVSRRGRDMEVYIDGTLVDTINQYSATLIWQKPWDSPALSPGLHKVRLVHSNMVKGVGR